MQVLHGALNIPKNLKNTSHMMMKSRDSGPPFPAMNQSSIPKHLHVRYLFRECWLLRTKPPWTTKKIAAFNGMRKANVSKYHPEPRLFLPRLFHTVRTFSNRHIPFNHMSESYSLGELRFVQLWWVCHIWAVLVQGLCRCVATRKKKPLDVYWYVIFCYICWTPLYTLFCWPTRSHCA